MFVLLCHLPLRDDSGRAGSDEAETLTVAGVRVPLKKQLVHNELVLVSPIGRGGHGMGVARACFRMQLRVNACVCARRTTGGAGRARGQGRSAQCGEGSGATWTSPSRLWTCKAARRTTCAVGPRSVYVSVVLLGISCSAVQFRSLCLRLCLSLSSFHISVPVSPVPSSMSLLFASGRAAHGGVRRGAHGSMASRATGPA